MSVLYFIRHGQARFGTDDYDRLSDLGVRQAHLLGAYFQRLGVHFDAAYSGSLLRQRQTAQAVMEGGGANRPAPTLQVSEAFNEFDSEAVLKAQMEDLVRENPSLAPDLHRIETDPKAFRRVFDRALGRMLGNAARLAEDLTVTAFIRRVRSGIEEVAKRLAEEETAAIFTSGGTLAAVMHTALSLNEQETIRLGWQIQNASVSRFRYKDGRLTLMSFNCTAHLEEQNDPALLTYL